MQTLTTDPDACLLIVQERFSLSTGGLTLVPNFAAPQTPFAACRSRAILVTPNQMQSEVQASYALNHFRLADASGVWRVVVTLSGIGKQEVPVGSALFVPSAVCRAIIGDKPSAETEIIHLHPAGPML